MSDTSIEGVSVHPVQTHQDERGFFREIARLSRLEPSLPVRQISHSLVHAGVVKAWHGHRDQGQWNYVINGLIKAVLFDSRQDSPTRGRKMEILCGDGHEGRVYFFPPGVLHGYRCIHGPMNILYFTTGEYDPSEEIRVDHDDSSIGYKWHEQSKY
jgi:dTDP-4-dehydrorhamnose 3,5-epimerase